MHHKNLITAGKQLTEAAKVLIMLHGRGATAEDILTLAPHLHVEGYALIAPQATNNTWYPYSFLEKPARNEPWLSSALALLREIVAEINDMGISSSHIFFLGFSQGACLALEFAARHANQYGGVVAFTGGLIGDKLYAENYAGNFKGTPVFIGSGNPDMHVPVERVYATANIFRSMHASVTEKIYDGIGHTIISDEIASANEHVFGNRELVNR